MTEARFDELIHAPNRLQICALLNSVDQAEFSTIRDMLGVADSVASKHLKALVDGGYVKLAKPTGVGRVKTWASLTREGRAAFVGHVLELQRLASGLATGPATGLDAEA